MSQGSLAPPEVWRHLLRATLLARKYMYKYVVDRYRKKLYDTAANDQKHKQSHPSSMLQKRPNATSLERQKKLHKSARNILSFLQRGNQGYQQPLNKILMLAYGRIGPKKYTLLSHLLPNTRGEKKSFNSSAEIEEYLEQKKKEPVGDDWQLPEVLQSLIKAQRNSSYARSVHGKRFRASDTLNIPNLNSWMKPVPECRRANIRKRLLNRSKYAALPPPDPNELNILRGLIDGTEPWKPPVRRVKVAPAAEQSSLETLIYAGPQGGLSFRQAYLDGRPHRLTRRFMRTLWERIYKLMPRQGTNLKGQLKFSFPESESRPIVLTMGKEEFQNLFGDDDHGHDAQSTAVNGQQREY
ncbi:conserved hypothetical protein [Talaromyces stipitatus ATCC 10500]|uniref:LYR motif-containing protein Cup1-like N-terminal domain-containing protein n=1 Tax=Talaromyces stipitatus (strain ATCC 10500 / CBS 375.48 / QM 6759 / NRRL 1006) TaxID=441959 RepID=B8MIT2_TALSN|nr:uncharacterized protein TSTA_050330 [Talaromyces stipitatus ATCC 10500]EED15594.1 conserved hypothetical protein [Talaromyces stipitatus ATCC 10500]